MSGLEKAVMSWRDAREAIFKTPVDMKATPEQFLRLAAAEDELMQLARKLQDA